MRNQSTKYFSLLAACMLVSNAWAVNNEKPETPLTPQDFAYAVPLQFEGQDALYQTTLPLSVYQHSVRSDLGDLRVFNAQSEVVPHMLLQPERSSISQPVLSKLSYFPLRGPATVGLDQLSIHIKRNTAGSLIDINSNAKPASSAKLSGYLLDASSLKISIQALVLEWSNSKENFVGTLNVEGSDDLKHWRTVVRDAPLASLQYGGHSLLQKRVEFSPVHNKYLRLSWPQDQPSLQLTGINAELAAARVDTPLTWQTAQGIVVADKVGEYQFDLGAHLPLQRLRITLPQMNTLVQTNLLSRANSNDAWHPVSNALLYRLHHAGQDLNNADILVAGNQRYWLLRVDQKGGGLGSGVLQLQAGWLAQQLQFVARGAAPFQLAYGSNEIKPAEFQLHVLLGADEKIQSAQTGAQIALGGDARLSPAPPALPWKKWSLWAVLCIAVLLLGWMAYRLVQQMESSKKH
jgi:hypothetical protein